MDIPVISIVIPIYNEEDNIRELYNRLVKILSELKVSYEIIFSDDGSKDNSWSIIEGLHAQDSHVRGIKLSRNFGHQYALKAGLDYSRGEAVVSLDGDLQQPPEMIKDFYLRWKEGFDIVYALRVNTKGVSFWKEFNAKAFYSFLNLISDIRIERGASDFRLLDIKVINEIKNINENQLFLRGIVSWLGFKSISLPYIANERHSGRTKYSVRKMLRLAIDGIMSFSIRPLRIATVLGVLISSVSFLYIFYALYQRIILNLALPGWTSILISVLFLGGAQLLSIGLLGEYIGKLFMESKKRRSYVIDKLL
jgi:dolichol-phosphate mannosyltransferase